MHQHYVSLRLDFDCSLYHFEIEILPVFCSVLHFFCCCCCCLVDLVWFCSMHFNSWFNTSHPFFFPQFYVWFWIRVKKLSQPLVVFFYNCQNCIAFGFHFTKDSCGRFICLNDWLIFHCFFIGRQGCPKLCSFFFFLFLLVWLYLPFLATLEYMDVGWSFPPSCFH